eukprot:CAMPEP_0176370114 /NCGR_PEP_ID=MMETSP0126-20121128/23758_1 /TAXON_ID=141414 ORGANISM="Strombidinopsis acuminatum, Strain SPMC142" /NCGR_SAMPLE_ID=MMETSP0126 /ASSEMBLY_ACC=CAM_ASM_000229 /LENGTH=130 /DNA_ID=CAMNT_0017729015 /DNA_START=445 /DNA_END=837 /DNA_ORIENTATION=+
MYDELYREFIKLKTTEMIEIIQDFPESMPCLTDIKFALDKTNMKDYLTFKLREMFENRLLILGNHTTLIISQITTLIISQYISTFRVMKLLDPSTIMLEIVSKPIKEYLRKRPDTLKRIVWLILHENDLY